MQVVSDIAAAGVWHVVARACGQLMEFAKQQGGGAAADMCMRRAICFVVQDCRQEATQLRRQLVTVSCEALSELRHRVAAEAWACCRGAPDAPVLKALPEEVGLYIKVSTMVRRRRCPQGRRTQFAVWP